MLEDLPIMIAPGIYKEASAHASKNRYIDGSNVRFWKGFPERIGGWDSITDETTETPARGIKAWRALDGTQFLALGGASYLTLLQGGTLDDITPANYVSRLITVSSVSGSWTLNETITGGTSGSTAKILADGGTVLSVGAITGEFTDGETITGGTSSVTATVVSSTFGGNIDSEATYGWGDSTWSVSVWGGVQNLYSAVDHCTTWSLCNWGEDLIANPRGGKIYVWEKTSSPFAAAVQVTNSPSTALGVFVADVNRTLVALGAHDGSADDPLNIRWSNSEDYTEWTAAADNTAGSIRCETGNTIIGYTSARGGYMISTDTAIYSFRYIGGQFIFSLNKVTDGPSMIGPNAGVDVNGVSIFMGPDQFYVYDGVVRPLPCDVHAYVYGRINKVQRHKVYCATNKKFNEVWWFYPSATENDSFVMFNYEEKTWSIGDIARTSWSDDSVVFKYPIGTDENGSIFAHEYGTSADGSTYDYSLETGDIEIMNGQMLAHNRMLIPDWDRISGTHNVTIKTLGYPNRTAGTKGPYSFTSDTFRKSVRARSRQFRLLFEGSDDFRLGLWKARTIAHGRKE